MFAVTHMSIAAARTSTRAPRARRAPPRRAERFPFAPRRIPASSPTRMFDICDARCFRRVRARRAGAPRARAGVRRGLRGGTKELTAPQRGLLREGTGDVEAYFAKADAYFSGYKWDHQGHTNSFSALMNIDAVIREQAAYLRSTGGAWTPDSVPPTGTPKARILEGYLQNAERCVVKEGYPKFNAMDAEQRAEWKAITCTQGLVAPAD